MLVFYWGCLIVLATTAIALWVAQLLKTTDVSIVDEYRCTQCDARFFQCRTTQQLCCESCNHVPPLQGSDT